MERDTKIGGRDGRFPLTRHSVVLAARSESPEVRRQALDTLIASYWKPVYKYLRLRWRLSNEEAKDLTQGFFTHALEKEFFARFEPAKARFRTWLRVGLDGYAANQHKAATRLKRGGDLQILPLDFDGAEGELAGITHPEGADPDTLFHREWVRGLFADALADLRAHCESQGKYPVFAVFERYDVEGPDAAHAPSYAELADEFGVPVTQITNYLAWARREFRGRVLARLRAATADDAEFRAEARDLLGVDPA